MARLLCVTNGLPGLLFSSLALARRLQAAGHDLTYAAPAGARPHVEALGLPFQALELEGLQAFQAADARHDPGTREARLDERLARAAEACALEPFEALLEGLRPDLLLLDGELHELVLAARGQGQRLALLNTFVSIWRRPGLPPPHTGIRPGRGWAGTRAGMALHWRRLFAQKRRRERLLRKRHAGCDRVSVLRHLARARGLELDAEVDRAQWLMPFTWRRLPQLCLHALEFEFPHRPARHVHYVGPQLLRERPEEAALALTGDQRARLDALLSARPAGQRLLYAGFGSFLTAGTERLAALLRAVAARPDWTLLLSLGGRPRPEGLPAPPDNVVILPWVPQLEVLAAADLAVTHGGINTITECIAHAVPMLVQVGAETDMAGNAARVEHLGLGLRASGRADDAEALRAQAERLLGDADVAANLRTLRQRCDAYAEDRVAERTVEELLAG